MNTPKFVIVYSALHTGTWFAVDLLTSCAEPSFGRSDEWLLEISNHGEWESLVLKPNISQNTLSKFINNKPEGRKWIEQYDPNLIVIQSHHRNIKYLYTQILKGLVQVPVIIPVRDPLYALNTRIWRESGSIKELLEQDIEQRVNRARDQARCMARLCALGTPKNTCFFAVDIHKNREERAKKIIEFCELSPTESTTNFINQWKPANVTKGGIFPRKERGLSVKDSDFQQIKQAIDNGKFDTVDKIYNVEMSILRREIRPVKLQFKKLGYTLDWL